MTTRELPARPSLEHLKAQAKDLLDALRERSPGALTRFRDSLPAAHGASDTRLTSMNLALHDAQSVIAREYGFQSWSELKTAVELAASHPEQLTPEALRALLERLAKTPPPAEVQQAMLAAASAPVSAVSLPAELPLVPLRNTVLSVGAVAPIMIGRPSSIAAIEAARKSNLPLAMFGQKNELDEAPTQSGLHPVGCVAIVHALIPAPEGLHLVVRAAAWIRLRAITREKPYLQADVERFSVNEQITPEASKLEQELRARARHFISTLPDAGRMQQTIDRMTPLELADSAMANLKCGVDAKALYAAEPDLVGRLRHVIAMFDQNP